jgi:hypothetical protein
MEGGGFWTGMLTGHDDHVAGLEDLTFPMTQGTQETHDFPVQVEELDVQVHPSQGVQRRGRTKGLAKRTKNFDPKEDIIVCSAWLNVSKDPINGANQSRTTFWSRVHAYFEKHKTTPAVRTESSLMHRWLTIQFQVNKYCACYEAIERRNQSGKTIQDKVSFALFFRFGLFENIYSLTILHVQVSDALELYKELDKDKKSFTLIPCWNKLKEEDKWKAKRVELAEQEKLAAKKKQKVNG